MNAKLDYGTYKAEATNGVIVGPDNKLTVEQSVRLEMIKLILKEDANRSTTTTMKTAKLYADFILRGDIPE